VIVQVLSHLAIEVVVESNFMLAYGWMNVKGHGERKTCSGGSG